MSTHVNLVSVRQTAKGLQLPQASVRVRENWYSFILPASQVGSSGVVVAPGLVVDEESNSVRIRFDSWRVFHSERSVELPLRLVDMATAAEAAMAFEADQGIDWSSPVEELESWVTTWLVRHEARTGGDR